jgi:hypothetical protein
MDHSDWYAKGEALADQTGLFEAPPSRSKTFVYSFLAIVVPFVAFLVISNFLNR